MFDFPITSPQTNEIAAALAQAQATFPLLKPDSKAEIRKDREHRYASLGAVLDAIRGPLNSHGITYTQPLANLIVTPARKRVKGRPATPAVREQFLVTTLLHTSGQWIRSYYPIPQAIRIDPQAMGSQMTYARRYSIAAITGLAIEDDDDGRAAQRQADRRNPPVRQEAGEPYADYTTRARSEARVPGGDDDRAPTRPATKKKPHTGTWLVEAANKSGCLGEFITIGQRLGYPADFHKWTIPQVDEAIRVRTEGFQQ